MSGRDIYLRSCEQLGVVPASYFLANFTAPVLNMSHHCLGPLGAKAMAPPLVVESRKIERKILWAGLPSGIVFTFGPPFLSMVYTCSFDIIYVKITRDNMKFLGLLCVGTGSSQLPSGGPAPGYAHTFLTAIISCKIS